MNIIDYIPFISDLPIEHRALIVIISAPILVWLVSLTIRTIIMMFILGGSLWPVSGKQTSGI